MAPKKAAAKAAPAPAAETAGFEVGQTLRFVGYGEDVPEAEQVLEVDGEYVVVELAEETGNPVVEIENPDFNPKKKENAETNPKLVQVECFPEEVEVVAEAGEEAEAAEGEQAEEGAAEEAAEEAEQPAQAAPAKVAKGKAAAKAGAPAKPAAKTAAKGKAAAKEEAAAPAAKKGKAAKEAAPEKAEAEEKVDELSVDLEGEDEEVIALVEGSEDLITTAQELEANIGHTEWQIGGLLYHIRKNKSYLEVDGAKDAGYAEKGGFETFLRDYFNVEYRKAMYLIQIYVRFTQAQIENPGEVVARLGWTKAQKIAVPMAAEDANVEELIELADENTVADLSKALMEQVDVGGKTDKGESKKRLTVKFRWFEEEAKMVDTVLKRVQEELGLKDVGDALLHIIGEYEAQAGGEAEQAEAPQQAAKPAARAAGKPARKTAARAAA